MRKKLDHANKPVEHVATGLYDERLARISPYSSIRHGEHGSRATGPASPKSQRKTTAPVKEMTTEQLATEWAMLDAWNSRHNGHVPPDNGRSLQVRDELHDRFVKLCAAVSAEQ